MFQTTRDRSGDCGEIPRKPGVSKKHHICQFSDDFQVCFKDFPILWRNGALECMSAGGARKDAWVDVLFVQALVVEPNRPGDGT